MYKGEIFSGFILVSIGGALGAGLRYVLLKYFSNFFPRKFLSTAIVNNTSLFLLGLVIPVAVKHISENYVYPFFLFFLIGLISSLSTFSSFIFEGLKIIESRKWDEFFIWLFISLVGGLFFLKLGYSLGTL